MARWCWGEGEWAVVGGRRANGQGVKGRGANRWGDWERGRIGGVSLEKCVLLVATLGELKMEVNIDFYFKKL